jgi:hypothetical protein
MASPDGLRLYFGSRLPEEVLELIFQYGWHLWLAKPHLIAAYAANSVRDLTAWELTLTVRLVPASTRFKAGVADRLGFGTGDRWRQYRARVLGTYDKWRWMGLDQPRVFPSDHRYRWVSLPDGKEALATSLNEPLRFAHTSKPRVFYIEEREWRVNEARLKERPFNDWWDP